MLTTLPLAGQITKLAQLVFEKVRRSVSFAIPLLIASPDIIEGSKKRPPVFPPNYKSTYSNIAFILLGFVLENVTGQSYQEALSASILKPLGMHHTTVVRPRDSMGVIPAVRNDWMYIAGAYDP